MKLNLVSEVEHYVGRLLNSVERRKIRQQAALGLVNPIDLARLID